MILIVTYDLKGPSGSYTQFYETLKAQGSWWHYLKSTWLLATKKTPDQVVDALKPYLNEQDRLLVTVMGEYEGWLPKAAWDWIHKKEAAN